MWIILHVKLQQRVGLLITYCGDGAVQVSVLNGDKKMTSTIDATPAGIS